MNNIQLIHGEALEEMDKLIAQGIKVDAVITDPPYKLENHGGGNTDFAQRKLVKDLHIDFMSNSFDETALQKLIDICKIPNIIMFCSNKQISWLMNYFENKKLSTTLLVWEKTNAVPFGNGKYIENAEFIIFVRGKKAPFNNLSVKEKSKIKHYNYPIKNRKHPAEKPLDLLSELLLTHTNENDLVLDPFIGSGTTMLACQNLNRLGIGIEKDEKYYKIAQDRLNNSQLTCA